MNNGNSADELSRESSSRPTDTSDRPERGTGAIPRRRIVAHQLTDVMQQAQNFQQQGRLQDAVELCQLILESGFDRPDVRYFLGWLYQEQQRWDDAVQQFQRSLHDSDYVLSCYFMLGQCYRECGDLVTATAHFDKAIELIDLDTLSIEDADELVGLCQEAAEAHYRLGEHEQALTVTLALHDLLRSRGWSQQEAQVAFMREQLQKGLPPRLGTRVVPAPIHPQKHSRLEPVLQSVMHSLSTISPLHLQRVVRQPLRPNWLWRTAIILALICVALGSIGIWSYAVDHHSHNASSTAVRSSRSTPHASASVSRTISPTASLTTNPSMANLYNGTLYDIPTGLTTTISLTKIQQRQRTISGYFGGMPAAGSTSGIPRSGLFAGTIDASKHVQFILTNNTGEPTFTFDGQIHPDNIITGTYCNAGGTAGKCSDYGLWSVSP